MRAVTWKNENEELYDFNTNPQEDNQRFKGFEQEIPIPKKQK